MIFKNDKISNNVYTKYSIKSTRNGIQWGFLICMYVCMYIYNILHINSFFPNIRVKCYKTPKLWEFC